MPKQRDGLSFFLRNKCKFALFGTRVERGPRQRKARQGKFATFGTTVERGRGSLLKKIVKRKIAKINIISKLQKETFNITVGHTCSHS